MDNGLLYTDGKEKAVTWMNSTANGRPVVPRTGYIVEFNALWYNALCFCAAIAGKLATRQAQQLLAQAEITKQSFVDTFLNEYGYLYDYVDGNMMDWSVRPNMIFPVAFDYSPLSQTRRRGYSTSVPANFLHLRDCVRSRQRVADITLSM